MGDIIIIYIMNNLKNYEENSLLQTISDFIKNFIFGFLYIL